MKQKEYSIGLILRLGLLKNRQGKPYKDKASVSRIVKNLKHKEIRSPYGMAKVVSEKEIEKWNKRWQG